MLATGMQTAAAAAPGSGYARLPGSVSPLISRRLATAVGAVQGQQTIRFLVGLASQDPGGLMSAAKTNTQHHVQLTASQVAAQYGASAATLAAVVQYFTGQGFIYLGAEPDGLALTFEGDAAQVDGAFQTTLENYKYQGHEGYLPSTGLAIPAALQGMVTGVLGLDTLLQPMNMLKIDGKGSASSLSALNHTALEMQTAYHVTPLYQNGYDGTGETIAVATWAAYNPKDVATFDTQMGLPSNNYVNGAPFQVIDGKNTGSALQQGGTDETTVDVSWSHAFAPGAAQEVAVGNLTNTPSFTQSMYDVFSALSAGTNSLVTPNVITTSWGYQEFYAPPQTNQVLDELFASIAAQGITMFAASGDGNVEAWNVLYPASDPYMVGVGGTQLSLHANGTIASEQAWGQAPFDQFYTASTGGYSTQFVAPPWALSAQQAYAPSTLIPQTAPYLPGMRGVPDVALNAFGYLGYWNGNWYGFLGTSLGAPSWAGIYADMNQMAVAQTHTAGLGDVAPALYAVADQANSPFHDITQGTNGQFNAAPGWDPVTGLGTPDVAALSQDLVTYILANGPTSLGPFISAVTPSAADGTNNWLGVSDPLIAMDVPGMNVTLTDSIVAGTMTQISGSGFGKVAGSVYLESNDGAIDIPLTVASWGPNAITLDTSGAISAAPGLYGLVVNVLGMAQPLVMGVALESGITLSNLNLVGGSLTTSGPLSVDSYWTVGGAVYANGLVSALLDVLGIGSSNPEMPAALYLPSIATPTQPQGGQNEFLGTTDNLLVTLTSPQAQLLSFSLNPLMVNTLPIYGIDANGDPQYVVPAGEPIAVMDPAAETVGMVVQDLSNPGLVAPAQAVMTFQPGSPDAANALQGGVSQTATTDPNQAVPILLEMNDMNGNVVPDQPGSWQVDFGSSTVMATVYYQGQSGGQPTWVQATPSVTQGVYDVPQSGPTVIAITDPTVGDTLNPSITAENVSGMSGYPLSTGTSAYIAPIQVVPQSSLVMAAVNGGTPQLGVPEAVGLAVYGKQGNVVSASDPISIAVGAGNVTLYDQHMDPILPNQDGTYPVALDNGQATFYYTTLSSGPVQLLAYDNAVYLPPATLTQNVPPGPAQTLTVNVFSSASVGSGTQYGENPQEIVVVQALDPYGNLASGFNDAVGLNITGGSGVTVTDGSGNALTQAGGLYQETARSGQAVFLVSSKSPGTLGYRVEDLGGSGATPGDASGTFLSPYASELMLSVGGSVVGNGSIWAGVPQKVTIAAQDALGNTVTSNTDTVALAVYGPQGAAITVKDAAGNVLSPDQNGAYEAQLQGGNASLYVTSSLAGGISYGAADLSVPSVVQTTQQATVSTYPITLDPVPVTMTDSTGHPATVNQGTITLVRGGRYDIQLAFANNDGEMPVTPIVEVIGPNGSIAFLQGVKASVQSGQETIEFAGFTPDSTGAYTVKVFTWNNWLQQGGVPIGAPYHLTVQSQ